MSTLLEKAAAPETRLDAYLTSVDADILLINPAYDPSKPTGFTGNRRDRNAFLPHDPTIDVKRLYYPDRQPGVRRWAKLRK